MKTARNVGIIVLISVLIAIGIIFIEKNLSKSANFSSVDFVDKYTDIKEEDIIKEKEYAELIAKVFKNMNESSKDSILTDKKPDLSFITHSDGDDIRLYHIYIIDLIKKDLRIYSVNDEKVYTPNEEGISYLYQIDTVKNALFESEPPRTILMTTVDSGPRILGTVTGGEWHYICETGEFRKADIKLSDVKAPEAIDPALYNFKIIFTKTPDKANLYLVNAKTEEETLIEDYKAGETIKGISLGKDYIFRLEAEWNKSSDKTFYGNITYEFSVSIK